MIKLIPDITVARLQKKTTPTSVAQDSATPSAVTKNAKVSTVTPTAEPKDPPRRRPPQHINLGELKSRLQNAYHISTPKVAVSHYFVHDNQASIPISAHHRYWTVMMLVPVSPLVCAVLTSPLPHPPQVVVQMQEVQ